MLPSTEILTSSYKTLCKLFKKNYSISGSSQASARETDYREKPDATFEISTPFFTLELVSSFHLRPVFSARFFQKAG